MRAGRPPQRDALSTEEYQRLLAFRVRLRRFLHWSETEAAAQGLTAAQHQLLLAIRGHADQERGPSVGDVAEHLLLKHHSAVGLIDRAEAAGLVRRRSDPANRSTVRLALTEEGARRLAALSALHLEEVPRFGAAMCELFSDLDAGGSDPSASTGRR